MLFFGPTPKGFEKCWCHFALDLGIAHPVFNPVKQGQICGIVLNKDFLGFFVELNTLGVICLSPGLGDDAVKLGNHGKGFMPDA